jgi:uncharacterized protein with HEPN domain
MPRDLAYLRDMALAIESIFEFVGSEGRTAFLSRKVVQSAVQHELIVVGEAAGRLSEGFCSDHPDIPWPKVVSFRNVLVHEYDRVDMETVWNVCETHLPSLLGFCRRCLEEERE